MRLRKRRQDNCQGEKREKENNEKRSNRKTYIHKMGKMNEKEKKRKRK
jgi:hypothetical protein